jgi:hypothetical protein
MLGFESALFRYLRNHAAVGPLLPGGIQPVDIRQVREGQKVVYPCAVYTKISGQEDVTHSGATGHQAARYQIDVYARDAIEARRIADALRGVLNGYKGDLLWNDRGVDHTVEVGGIWLEDEDASYVDEFQVHWVRQDYTTLFAET